MDNKEIYRQYCSKRSVPLYLKSEWLDTVTKSAGDWDVIFSRNAQQEIQGFWVYVYKTQLFWRKVTMPPYTPYMGPRLIYPANQTAYERISFENKVLSDLISQMPSFSSIAFKWTKGYSNWLPFYWKGYRQQTAYTYLIKDTSDPDIIFKNFKNSIQRQIRKAQQHLTIRQTEQLDGVINMFTKSVKGQAGKLVDKHLLEQLHQVAIMQDQAIILEALDEHQNVTGAIYLIFDEEEIVYLYGGYDDAQNDSGAMPLLFWRALELAGKRGLTFNFEGSMLKGVERFFRSFGSEQTPVYTIEKKGFPYKYLRQ